MPDNLLDEAVRRNQLLVEQRKQRLLSVLRGASPDINFLSGTAKPGPYVTPLSFPDEVRFLRWVKANRVPWRDEPQADYDMRGFWKALQSGDPRATTEVNPFDKQIHFTDAWKSPYHEGFSNESIYATPNAPAWQGERYLKDRLGRIVYDQQTGRSAR